MLGYDNLNMRPRGLLNQYMTFSGVLMLVTCAAVARLVFGSVRSPWPLVAVPALLVALIATYTRNAWIGTLLGVTLGAVVPEAHIAALTATGGLLLVGIAFRLLNVRHIPVGDLLPALLVAPLLVSVVGLFR